MSSVGKRTVAAMLRMVKCAADAVGDAVQLLAPFNPVVWGSARFERFWNWRYRFEAYTPSSSGISATTRCPCCGTAT
jgi:uncharacterized protein YcaQ